MKRWWPEDKFIRLMVMLSLVGLVLAARGVRAAVLFDREAGETGKASPDHSGPELLAVYIGSSTCIGSKIPEFRPVQQQVMRALGQLAEHDGLRFRRIGVAVDVGPRTGFEYLDKFGPFDSKLVGGGWENPGAVDYLFRGLPGDATIPQIVIVQRHVEVLQNGLEITRDSLWGRLIGIDGMRQWLARQPGAKTVVVNQ